MGRVLLRLGCHGNFCIWYSIICANFFTMVDFCKCCEVQCACPLVETQCIYVCYFLDIVCYWLKIANVSHLICNASRMIPSEFCKWYRKIRTTMGLSDSNKRWPISSAILTQYVSVTGKQADKINRSSFISGMTDAGQQ